MNLYQKLAFLFFKSDNHLSQFPEWKILPPMSKHTREETAKTGKVYCLFVSEWIHILSWKCTVSRILIIFLDIPPIGINTIFLICPPIYSWPQQEFLGVRSPWKCVTLIPNIFPKKIWVKVWWIVQRFAWIFQIKKLTQGWWWGRDAIEAAWLPDPWQKSEIQGEWQQQPFILASLLFWFYLNWKDERAWEAANVNAMATDNVKCVLGRYTALLLQRWPTHFKVEAKHLHRADRRNSDCFGSWP